MSACEHRSRGSPERRHQNEPMSQRARRHHIVPQFFLRRFANDRHLIRMYDHETEQEQDISPRRAAWELDYYTVETESGPSDAIETALSRGEALSAEALRE